MVITQRHTEIFTAIVLYINLVLFDLNLYPNLALSSSLILSGLRFSLLISPLIVGYCISRYNLSSGLRIPAIIIWLLCIPYTSYSFTEIRHISELCRLPAGRYYTEVCLSHAWMLMPIFVYALGGILIFVFSVSQVTNSLFKRSYIKRLAIIGICFYSALAGTFGLFSRLNVWDIATRPGELIQAIAILPTLDFFYNAIILMVFYILILFITNRMMRWSNRYIQEQKD